MVTAWSGAWRSRPSRSCRSAPRPMVIPSAAALRIAVIWDANLGLRLHAAQEFRLVDHRDAKRLRLRELRAGIRAGHHRGGLLPHAVRDVLPPGAPAARIRRAKCKAAGGSRLEAWLAATSCPADFSASPSSVSSCIGVIS